jgi:hypothetical protein
LNTQFFTFISLLPSFSSPSASVFIAFNSTHKSRSVSCSGLPTVHNPLYFEPLLHFHFIVPFKITGVFTWLSAPVRYPAGQFIIYDALPALSIIQISRHLFHHHISLII